MADQILTIKPRTRAFLRSDRVRIAHIGRQGPPGTGGGGAAVSDVAYDATSWNGVATIAPSKNAVRDFVVTLGSAAFQPGSAFDPAGSAAAAQAASQPLDTDLTAIAALATAGFGRGALTQADAAAFRDYIGVSPAADPTTAKYVLRFNGLNHVTHPNFWSNAPVGSSLGTEFFWEAWVKPRASALGYLISDGAGGEHALLLGFDGVSGGCRLTGNFWTGSTSQTFVGSYIVAVGEWVHVAVMWTSVNVYLFVNGIIDSGVSAPGPRVLSSTSGDLFVGGSDHLNLTGDVAFIRGFDTQRILPLFPDAGWRPSRFPTAGGDFVCDYTGSPRVILQDQSLVGFSLDSVQRWHHGAIGSPFLPRSLEGSNNVELSPVWVRDDACPFGQSIGAGTLPAENIPAPGSVPSGAKVFDSFGRRNQTWAFQDPTTLGQTEGGSLGPLTWSDGSAWGILGGQVRHIGNAGIVFIPVGTADMDVRITGGPRVGLCFRVVDANNYWYFYALNTSVGRLGHVVVGVNDVVSVYPSVTFTTLRIVASGTTINVYADGTLIDTVTDATLQTAQGAGMATSPFGGEQSTENRYSNFTVF